ncbi:hypothetical protein LTR91_017040 [Friedmanniomyces endolithicus]|uniref:Uncharacterized protein n=1 Tax=Friedmanniomyces endolithicus TaxID=329885 RepID=A0AAN6QK39_9PEZI|nr:hypothetical protein LTR57_021583 [Friedmanniomyces endolithicus]KAK0964980.1 hypothetical protein LTS01_018563 [Friedmanniomyces endolithicus]KAK0967734.1 hypothetical protein LTR91_017040 [Friedmanniomyces endolithicus]KAK1031473.1 hypothetical protein LTS16_017986 [Friedmanniomyces endolithicus]KAK1073335.1 hypothetical protein LTR33_010024 [Friedmanniomyces endolithicus]
MASSSHARAPITTTGISTFVDVYDYVNDRLEPSRRSKRLAAYYLAQGYRVTDQHSFDLMVETRNDGSRHLIRGEDVYITYMDRNRRQTILGATSRPANLPERPRADYERGAIHIIDECETPNCDHPVHFGGTTTGELAFSTPESKADDAGEKGGEGVGEGGGETGA